jgi:tetratricopeptide (TPR) repeat protein/predicted Ser/Thr protein kinase
LSRSVSRLIGLGIWLAAAGAIYLDWKDLVAFGNDLLPNQGTYLVGIGGFLLIFFLVVAWSWVEDRIVKDPEKGDKAPERKKSREEIEKEVEAALKEGNKPRAMELAEAYNLFSKAAEIARDLGDKPALVRLFTKMGHHDRARRYCVELKDYEGAAQSSALMGEIKTARELYKEAAVMREAEGAPVGVLAGLWDRAGDYLTAAKLYENAGELERAAECFELVDDAESAKRLREHAHVLQAYERRKSGDSLIHLQQEEEELKKDMGQSGQLLESVGDFLGAAQAYRAADQPIEAAVAFERMEEWERAAITYDKIGLGDRAALARTKIVKKPKSPEEAGEKDSEGLPTNAPEPSMVPQPEFVPLEKQMQYVPVYVRGQQRAPSPETQTKIAQRVRRGNFEEAAQFAQEANDYLMSAALYERAGNLLKAADVYRQIGKINDAMYCLEQANRPREAAMMSMAIGDDSRTIRVLSDAVDKDPEAGFMLGELLIERKRINEALQLLRDRLAPGGITEENALTYYRFARMLEEEGAKKEAYQIYCEMIIAGAESDDISDRQARLAIEMGSDSESDSENDAEIHSLAAAGATASATGQTSLTSPAQPRMFSFAAPEELMKQVPGAGGGGVPFARQAMSLFGGSAGQPEGFTELASDARPAPRQKSGDSDPFASQNRYDIKRELARGGMGVIYEAEDTMLGRMVALKLIQGMEGSTEAHQQFLLEARAIARLSHPNVVTIYDIGLMGMKHYITMELIRGKSLQDYVDDAQKLSLKEAMRVFVEIARGLQVAHENGIVHRDIKPGNILLNDKSTVKIVDFGLAKLHANAEPGMDKTIFKMSGTPGYMSPEQIDGEESLPRVDIYALGITLFCMLAGVPPHALLNKTKPRQIIAYQLAGKLPALKEICPEAPAAIDDIFKYCTLSNAEERYQSIDQFLPTAEQYLAAMH